MAKVIWYRLRRDYDGAPEEKALVYNPKEGIWFSRSIGKGGSKVNNPNPLYWEAMYTPFKESEKIEKEEEIKVGDWVEVLPSDTFYYNSEKCPQQVIRISKGATLLYQLRFKDGGENGYSKVRKVKAEIDMLKTLKIAGYEPVITKIGVEFGCQKFTLDEVKLLNKLINHKEIRGLIKIQGFAITPNIISTIENAIINYKK